MKLIQHSHEQHRCFFDNRDQYLEVHWSALKESQINACFYAAFTPGFGSTAENQQLINRQFAALLHLEELASHIGAPFRKYTGGSLHPGQKNDFQHWAIQTIEGAYSIDSENALGLIDQYADMGVKAIALVWNHGNSLGGGTQSSLDLTPLGRLVIEKMEQRRILVDVSHMNNHTFWSTVKASTKPLIASHSGAYEITPHVRNLDDLQLKAIADTGGVINVVFHRAFVGDPTTASIEDVADHIMYICHLIGPEHVGIGSDFDGCDAPIDLEHIGKLNSLDRLLKRRGLRLRQRNGILGNNLARLLMQDAPDQHAGVKGAPKVDIRAIHHSITDITTDYEIRYTLNEPCEPRFWIDGIEKKLMRIAAHTYVIRVTKEQLEGYHLISITWGSENQQRKTTLINF